MDIEYKIQWTRFISFWSNNSLNMSSYNHTDVYDAWLDEYIVHGCKFIDTLQKTWLLKYYVQIGK